MAELTTLSRAELARLVEGLPTDKRAAFAKAARAACKHLRDSKENYAKAYDLACAMVRSWWRLGLELGRLEITSGRPPKNGPPGDHFTLAELGLNKQQSARCQKLAAMSADELEAWLESRYDEGRYYLPSLRPASEHVHVSENSGNPEWYTPPEYIKAARRVLDRIDLDPASSPRANEFIRAQTFYTLEDDGLSHDWAGTVWLNPPYSSGLVDAFMGKLTNAWRRRDIEAAITLTNNSTDTVWFQDAADEAAALCLVRGRVRFLDPDAPLQGQALLYFGPRVKRFAAAYRKFGNVWTKVRTRGST